jgi:hypothetical protein
MLIAVAKQSRLLVWPAALALFLVGAVGQTLAQPRPTMLGALTEIDKAYNAVQPKINRYLTGEKQASGPTDKEAQEAATAAAKWFVYRLTCYDKYEVDREFLPKIQRAFDKDFMFYADKYAAKNKVFMHMFDQHMIAAMKELLAQDFRNAATSQINAAVLLSLLGSYGDEDVGDYLAQVLRDPKIHDAIKVHVLKGLRAFFAALPPRVDPDTVDEKVRLRDGARVEAVVAFLDRKTPADVTPDEMEAVRYIRREAIKALAQTRIPALLVYKGTVKTPVALSLMKVLAAEKNDMGPAPSLTEKCEAAIGLCRTKTSVFEQYDPEAAIYLVGKFFLEFATKYHEDEGTFAPSKSAKETREKPPLLPWKYQADRLEKALKEFQTTVPAQASPAYKQKLKVMVDHCLPIVGKMKRWEQIEAPSVLEDALSKMWPSTPALNLFRGVPNLQIQMPALKEGA